MLRPGRCTSLPRRSVSASRRWRPSSDGCCWCAASRSGPRRPAQQLVRLAGQLRVLTDDVSLELRGQDDRGCGRPCRSRSTPTASRPGRCRRWRRSVRRWCSTCTARTRNGRPTCCGRHGDGGDHRLCRAGAGLHRREPRSDALPPLARPRRSPHAGSPTGCPRRRLRLRRWSCSTGPTPCRTATSSAGPGDSSTRRGTTCPVPSPSSKPCGWGSVGACCPTSSVDRGRATAGRARPAWRRSTSTSTGSSGVCRRLRSTACRRSSARQPPGRCSDRSARSVRMLAQLSREMPCGEYVHEMRDHLPCASGIDLVSVPSPSPRRYCASSKPRPTLAVPD